MDQSIQMEIYNNIKSFLFLNRTISNYKFNTQNNIKEFLKNIYILQIKTFNIKYTKKENHNNFILNDNITEVDIYNISKQIQDIINNIDITVMDDKIQFVNSYYVLKTIHKNIKHSIIVSYKQYNTKILRYDFHFYMNKLRCYILNNKEKVFMHDYLCKINLNTNDNINYFCKNICKIINIKPKRFKIVVVEELHVYIYLQYIIKAIRPDTTRNINICNILNELLNIISNHIISCDLYHVLQ